MTLIPENRVGVPLGDIDALYRLSMHDPRFYDRHGRQTPVLLFALGGSTPEVEGVLWRDLEGHKVGEAPEPDSTPSLALRLVVVAAPEPDLDTLVQPGHPQILPMPVIVIQGREVIVLAGSLLGNAEAADPVTNGDAPRST